MPTRPSKKGDPNTAADSSGIPGAPKAEDDGIEILEVVGVDETTGAEGKAPETAPREAPGPNRAAEPAGAAEASTPLKEALAEKEKYYDLLLRKQAEFENFRKRTERERGEIRSSVVHDLIKRLLPTLDNLERALRTSEGSNDPLRQGLVLVQQQFLEALRKEGVLSMDTLGTQFDPRHHEAVQVLDVEGFQQGVILEEMQRGYTLNDRLLRPALVKVASGRKPSAGGS